MKDFEIMQKLVGNTLTEIDLKHVDCYVRPNIGIFIPVTGFCGYASKEKHTHPSYMVVIFFNENDKNQISYHAEITSPDIKHDDNTSLHYYCILFAIEFFEKRFLMYSNSVPVFKEESFEICSDILKALNVEDYSIAKAQHFMELYYTENITVSKLAQLGYISSSCFNRRFKKEIGITPIEYLIEIRIQRAKILLQRKSIPITEIAMRCGFSNSAHFSSSFQSRLGITPTEYRDKYKG